MEEDYGGCYTKYCSAAVYRRSSLPPSVNLSEVKGQVKRTAFAGMADQEQQGEQKEEDPYYDYDGKNTMIIFTCVG